MLSNGYARLFPGGRQLPPHRTPPGTPSSLTYSWQPFSLYWPLSLRGVCCSALYAAHALIELAGSCSTADERWTPTSQELRLGGGAHLLSLCIRAAFGMSTLYSSAAWPCALRRAQQLRCSAHVLERMRWLKFCGARTNDEQPVADAGNAFGGANAFLQAPRSCGRCRAGAQQAHANAKPEGQAGCAGIHVLHVRKPAPAQQALGCLFCSCPLWALATQHSAAGVREEEMPSN